MVTIDRMNADIAVLVDHIFSHLQQLGSIMPGRRRMGMNVEIIAKVMHDNSLDASDELVALYASCDGTSTQEGENLREIQFFPGFYWMSLADALEVYRGF